MTQETGINEENRVQQTFHFDVSENVSKILNPKVIWAKTSSIVSLILLALLIWAIGYSVFGNAIGISSVLFKLAILFITAKVTGWIVSLIRIPPMVGMLLVGVLLRNVNFLVLTEAPYVKLGKVLRQLALVNILLPAGLGLDPAALKKMFWMILNLSVIPVAMEVIGVTVISRYVLDLPWLWGVLLGLLLAAVSPAVIIPCLFELQDLGYGVNKGIHTLVIAASTLNDIICIAFFGIVLGIIFSTENLTMQILQGPIVLALGFAYGTVCGLVCQYVPSQNEMYLVTLRTLLLGLGCVLSSLGSDAIGYSGAGALGCIVAAFVACLGWRKQGWESNNPVRANFVLLWKFFEPISFALIGIEVNFGILEGYTVLWGIVSLTVPLLLRMVTSFGATYLSDLNIKENLFVALSWVPKATVQATLGPAALDLARESGDPLLLEYSNTILIVAVISIIITSPIGAILIMQLGPKLLHRTTDSSKKQSISECEHSERL